MQITSNQTMYKQTAFGTNFTKKALMPILDGLGSIQNRKLMAKETADRIYQWLTIQPPQETLSAASIKKVLKQIVPGLNIKVEKLTSKNKEEGVLNLLNFSSKICGYKINIPQDCSIPKLMHEVTHVLQTAFNPKYEAKTKLSKFQKINAELIFNDIIYAKSGKILPVNSFRENYNISINSIKDLNQDQKLSVIKMHIRALEREQQAHKSETYFYFRDLFGKKTQAIADNDFREFRHIEREINAQKTSYKDEINSNFLFNEKIKILKEIFFEELKKARSFLIQNQ